MIVPRAVEVHIHIPHLGVGIVAAAEGEHEGDLGGQHAIVHGVAPGLKESGVAGLVGDGAVGVIREDGIHARGGQQLGLTAEHPLVAGLIVAVDGLVPGALETGGSPDGVVVVTDGLGVLLGGIVDVDDGGTASI